MVKITSCITAALAVNNVAIGHPGEDTNTEQFKREAASYSHAHQHMVRTTSSCANSPPVLVRQQRAIARRFENARQLREKCGIPHGHLFSPERRDEADLKKWAIESHKVDTKPYFVSGELMRTNVTEAMVIDVWHSNATGVYSGVSATGQGGLDSNFCRGVQITDADGVVQFDTVFPGHYAGRANHIHILSTRDATVLSGSHAYADGVAQAAATADSDVLMDWQMLGGTPTESAPAISSTTASGAAKGWALALLVPILSGFVFSMILF
ncbi:GPI anchored dioxygenase [Apiospora kogelbergensis]|uniref:GPI anchored dioxygenase n=1 Tax=Apiospora kogelbergensis TaxID=1337665 RepID=UPI003131EE90